jgi:hypothetical protein
MLTFFITDILLATPSSAASSPFIWSPPVTPLNVGSSESQHTVIHELPDPFLVSPSPPSSTNIYTTTTTTIIGCDQQQKEQLQRGEGEDTEDRLDELMKKEQLQRGEGEDPEDRLDELMKKEQLQRGEGEDPEDRFNKLMKKEIGHMGSVFSVFFMWVFDYFDSTEDALLMAGVFTLGFLGSVFF